MITSKIITIPTDQAVPNELLTSEVSVETPIIVQGLSAFKLLNMGLQSILIPLSKDERNELHKEQRYIDSHAYLLRNDLTKIPKDVSAYILKYLRAAYEKFHSESSVTLMFRPADKTWTAFIPLQIDASGGSVTYVTPLRGSALPKEIENAEEDVVEVYRQTQTDYLKLLQDGYRPVGTIHSHPGFSAFASGTDDHDEAARSGVHLTFGHIIKKDFDVHARLTINGYKWELDVASVLESTREEIAELADSIDIPEDLIDRIFERKQMPFVKKTASTYSPIKDGHDYFWSQTREFLGRPDPDDIVLEETVDDLEVQAIEDVVFLRHSITGEIIIVTEEEYLPNYQLFHNYEKIEMEIKEF